MAPDAIIMMVVMLAVIWGGFIFLINRAYRKEKKATKNPL